MVQPVGRKIRERDNNQLRSGEGHARLMAKMAFLNVDDGLVASTDP